MDKKRIILLCAMGLLLAAAIALGVAWVIEANEYAGYKADYVDIAEDVLRPDDDIVIIELAPPRPTPSTTTHWSPLPARRAWDTSESWKSNNRKP